MSRLGFAVMWPRREELERGVSLPEEPDTFIAGFRYLEAVDIVDRDRISMIGFSIGASIALVAAQDPAIADKLHALVFFGGYYNLADYFVSLATRTAALDGQIIPWDASDAAINHAREILQAKDAGALLEVFSAQTREEAGRLLRSVPIEEQHKLREMDPSANMQRFQARIFILHDQADPYVPYVQAIKLREALPPYVPETLLLVELFEHVQLGGDISWETVPNTGRLYGFVYETLGYL
jgi:pimeloyl-ACP methyl ester carboxylesterase